MGHLVTTVCTFYSRKDSFFWSVLAWYLPPFHALTENSRKSKSKRLYSRYNAVLRSIAKILTRFQRSSLTALGWVPSTVTLVFVCGVCWESSTCPTTNLVVRMIRLERRQSRVWRCLTLKGFAFRTRSHSKSYLFAKRWPSSSTIRVGKVTPDISTEFRWGVFPT